MKISKNKTKGKFNRLAFLALLIIIISYNFKIITINSLSMEPTIKINSIGIYSRLSLKEYSKGDIVIADIYNDPYYGNIIITKRIIGIPGDKIKITGNDIFVNENLVLKNIEGNVRDITVKLKEDEYYLLGDNYSNSYDSRYIGTIKKNQIRGKLIWSD